MSGFGILFLIFGLCTLLTGFYMYRGHSLEMLTWRAAFQHLSTEQWKNIGKWTMIVSIGIFVLAIVGLVMNS